MNKKPYRVIVWGTGGIGGTCLKEVILQPEFELAGVLVFSESKNGLDAGDLAGLGKTGVTTTMDRENIIALDADCVLHAPRDFGDWRQDEDIIRLLESGKNVVTSQAYHHPRNPEITARIEEACRKGGTSFHASGIDPGFVVERLAMTATGLSNAVESVKMQEINELSILNHDFLRLFGFGQEPDKIPSPEYAAHMADIYLRQSVLSAGKTMGVEYDRVEMTSEYLTTPIDIQLDTALYPKGTVACIRHQWVGHARGKPFFTLEVNWYIGEHMKPFPTPSHDCWLITIEGRPSVQLTLDIRASFKDGGVRVHPGDTIPSYQASAVPMSQAIPVVCAAKPGIVYPAIFTHYNTDLRNLAGTP